MRDGFRELAEGWATSIARPGDAGFGFRDPAGEDWLIFDGYHELGERIERLADWVMVHGGALQMLPDERQLIIEMLRQHLVLACRAFALGVSSL